MKTLIAIALFAFLAVSCVQLPKGHRVASLSFGKDPVNHFAEEAIEQIEIVAPSASVHRVGKMPTDWSAGIGGRHDGPAECTLNCLHQSFAEPDIHRFDGVVSLLVPEIDVPPEVKVRVWITRGPHAPGRVLELGSKDFFLR